MSHPDPRRLPHLDPAELLEATGQLLAAATRLSDLLGDVEWFVQPFRLDRPDEYADLREHVDAASREARAAGRVVYMIGQSALTAAPPPAAPPHDPGGQG